MSEHGEEAAIAAVNRVRSGGVAGFFCREEFEVIVDPDDDGSSPDEPVDHDRVDDDHDTITADEETVGQALGLTTSDDRPPARLAYHDDTDHEDPVDEDTAHDDPEDEDPVHEGPVDDRMHDTVPVGVGDHDESTVFAGPVPPGNHDRFLNLLERRLEQTSTAEADLGLRRANRANRTPTPTDHGAAVAPAPNPMEQLGPVPIPPSVPGHAAVSSEPRPVFWRRLDRVADELASFLPAGSPRTAVVGPLPLATAVVHRLQSTQGLASADVVVLTDRAGIVSQPSWRLVRTSDRLVRHLTEADRRSTIVVIDVPVDLPPWVVPLQRRLRAVGVGLFRYAIAGQPIGDDLERYRQGADVPYAIDLASRVDPDRIVELVAERHPIVSVAGTDLGPELLLAIRRHVDAPELLFEPVIDG